MAFEVVLTAASVAYALAKDACQRDFCPLSKRSRARKERSRPASVSAIISTSLVLGIRQSSKDSSAVGNERRPSLWSSLAEKGDVFLSTRKKDIPRGPNDLSVVARTKA